MEPTQTDIVYDCIRVSGSINYVMCICTAIVIDYIMSHLPHISSQGCGVCSAVAATAHVCFVPPFLTEFEENAAKKEIHKIIKQREFLCFWRARL